MRRLKYSVVFSIGSTTMMPAYSVSIVVLSLDVEAFFLVTRLVVTFCSEALCQQLYPGVPFTFPWRPCPQCCLWEEQFCYSQRQAGSAWISAWSSFSKRMIQRSASKPSRRWWLCGKWIGCNTGTGKPAVFPKRVGQVRVRCWILTHRRTPRTCATVLQVFTGLLQVGLSLLFLFYTKFYHFLSLLSSSCHAVIEPVTQWSNRIWLCQPASCLSPPPHHNAR